MYAVVEFKKSQCDIIPLSWLRDNQTKCLWPRFVTDEKVLSSLVHNLTAPKSSWTKCQIIKVHALIDDYEKAVTRLQAILNEAESTSHDIGDSNNNAVLKRKRLQSDSSDSEVDVKKPKKTMTKTKELHSNSSWSSDEEQPSPKKPRSTTHQQTQNLSSSTPIHQSVDLINISQNSPLVQNGEILNASLFSDVLSESNMRNADILFVDENIEPTAPVPNDTNQLLEEILKHVIYIREVQDQNSLRIAQLERLQQTATVQELTRPQSVPIFPINSKTEFEELENFLIEDVNRLYMRRRLAAVGGSSVRNAVMNILKFIMSNKVAMRFNWSGREKRPFKDTRIAAVINEAVKLAYSGREPAELCDYVIAQAIKDWLKLAKHRHLYKSERI